MLDNKIEIEVDVGLVIVDNSWIYLFAFIFIITICAARLLLNYIMVKKGVLPPHRKGYKQFNIIMLSVLIIALILLFVTIFYT